MPETANAPQPSRTLAARLGLRHPILQAPMAGVSNPRLAAAVTEAGGLGALGIGANTADEAREAIAELRTRTSGPFALNVFCHRPAIRDSAREAAWIETLAPEFAALSAPAPTALREIYTSFLVDPEQQSLLLEARPPVASFHFGLPDPEYLAALRRAGVFTIASVTSAAEASLAEAAGVDALVAQGVEAGGHRGVFDPDGADPRLGVDALVAALVPATELPVIAAGGIMSGDDIHRVLALGAAAAQLGTAFVASPESSADQDYRTTLRTAGAGATELTTAISGRPARGVTNRLIELGRAAGSARPADYPLAYDAGKQLHAAARALGDGRSYAAHWAGTGVHRARELPAGELVELLARELADAAAEGGAPAAEKLGEHPDVTGRWGSREDRDPHLELAADGALTGSDGCNRLMGRWMRLPNGVAFERVAATRMICPGTDTWLAGLASGKLQDGRLIVFDAAGNRIGELPSLD
ncbi:nitronate monooxygenase [Leucobacter sp. CSA2]|uniref:Probable nitronate monooxygenase n=1 Tax=Leucobacter edaphi TaxID=2796472 RepID=A0A934QCR4_9MICO|nr:nitronate monooxygenase [Leucobacter edaphi]MBK0422078.1 nitronate monooxygenase [Leucobacter edaphi]